MNTEEVTSQKVTNTPKKPVVSVILGIISIALYWVPSVFGTGMGTGFFIPMSIALICAILGLIWSIKGIKAGMKNLAIIGIILCSLGLVGAVLMFIGWLTVGGPTEL